MASRVQVCGIQIDPLRMSETVERLLDWSREKRPCRFVVTPNVDHAVMYHERADLRAAYADASLVLADGWPVVLAARLLRRYLPQRVPGSDLAPALFKEATRRTIDAQAAGSPVEKLRVFLLGAAPGVAQRAAEKITQRWPGVEIVGVYCPPLGFERDDNENAAILAAIRTAQPQMLIVGLGAPKQELWVHRHRDAIAAPVALCIGATIDFLAGEKRRAPRWMRRVGLEWLHRLGSEPRRLFKRYARDAWVFPRLVWRDYRTARRGAAAT